MEQKLQQAASALPETNLDFEKLQAAPKAVGRKGFFAGNARRAVLAAAACLLVLITAGFGTYAYAAEAREYNAAVQFFEENDLSTEGLTRAQIKAVYRDITTKSFTYSKTAEVIQKSLTTDQIGGYEIWQEEPTPEQLEHLWEYRNDSERFVPYEPPVYDLSLEFECDATGRVINEKYYLEKSEDGSVLWRAYLPFWHGNYYEVPDGVLAFGYKITYSGGSGEMDSWIYKIDNSGKVLWGVELTSTGAAEVPKAVLLNEDGSYTLFSCGDNRYLCVRCFTPDGKCVLYKETDLENFRFGHAAYYGDGYLLQISGEEENELARFIQVDRQGNVVDGFSYIDENYTYRIMDMVQWGGKVYVSAYTVPKRESTGNWHYEIQPILDYAHAEKIPAYAADDGLTAKVREFYTAVLLVCDPQDGGELQTFYKVPGALGGALLLSDDGRLVWETEWIAETVYSPLTNAFTIYGQCYVYQYSFDETGMLSGMGKIDRITNFYR